MLSYVDQTISNSAVGSTFAQYALPLLDQVVAVGFTGAAFAQDVGSFVSQLITHGLTDPSDQLPAVKAANAALLTALGDACISQGYVADGMAALELSAQLGDSPGPLSLSQSFVTVSTPSIPSGGTAKVSLIARDAAGNLETAGGLTVKFGLGSGTSSGTFSGVTYAGNGTYTATFTATTAGTARTITATIGGNAVTSALPAITVTPTATTATVIASLSASAYGQSVTSKGGSTTLGTGTLSTTGGVATPTVTSSMLAGRTHPIAAVYTSDTNHSKSTSAALSFAVGQSAGRDVEAGAQYTPGVVGKQPLISFSPSVVDEAIDEFEAGGTSQREVQVLGSTILADVTQRTTVTISGALSTQGGALRHKRPGIDRTLRHARTDPPGLGSDGPKAPCPRRHALEIDPVVRAEPRGESALNKRQGVDAGARPARRPAPLGRCATRQAADDAASGVEPGPSAGLSSAPCQIAAAGEALDLGGQRGIILGAAAGGGILEDRLAEAGTLGQPDVAADPRLEHLGVGPGRVGLAPACRRTSRGPR